MRPSFTLAPHVGENGSSRLDSVAASSVPGVADHGRIAIDTDRLFH
jgi:hypothetical protein